jgi:hypothetical protein
VIEALNPAYAFERLQRSDGARLHEINRGCPIEADFTFYFDRGADFFAWPDGAFERYRYIGIFCEEELVGYGMIGINRGWVGSELGQHLYLGDWRILPGHRGASLGQQGAEALAVDLPEELTCGYCLVKRGNSPVEWILRTRSADQWTVRHLCPFSAVNLLILFRPAAPRRHKVRRATAEDAELLADLMRRAWDGRLFAPEVTVDAVRQDIQRLNREGEGAYYLAERRGHPAGLLRAWDASAVRRTVVLGYTQRGRLIRLAFGAARHLLRGMASPPGPGEAFRSLTLHRVAVPDSDPAVLRDLLLAVIREHHGRGYHMAHLGLCGGDPLALAVRGLPAQRFLSEIHVITRRGFDPPEAERPVPWIDLERI